MWHAKLWSDGKVYFHLKDALLWNEQLELHLEWKDPEADTSAEGHANFLDSANGFADSARKNLGCAIDIVADRLRRSAP